MADTQPTDSMEAMGQPSQGETRMPGNRAAAGAHEAQALPPVDQEWQGGLGATDFLGLDTELRGAGISDAPDSGTGGSWLLQIESEPVAGGPSATAPYAPAAQANPVPLAYAPGAGAPVLDPGLDEQLAPTDDGEFDAQPDEFGAEGAEEARPAVLSTPGTFHPIRWLAAAAVLGLVGAGGWYAWQQVGPRWLGTEQVATNVTTTARPKPAPKTPKAPEVVPTPDTQPATAQADPDPATTPAVETAAQAEPSTPTDVEPPVSAPIDVAPPAATSTTQPVSPTNPPAASELTRSERSRTTPSLPDDEPGPGGGRRATEADWAGMWTGETIPYSAIGGDAVVRTLNVGAVRALLVSGEPVEGRLYAVGQSRVWLEVPLGRISFERKDVKALSRIVLPDAGKPGAPTPAYAGLPRVEVLVAGGALTGRVLEREGSLVTLVTDEGMRLKVEAVDVRPASSGTSRMVGRVDEVDRARKP